MISNKSKSIILLGVIMLSSAVFTSTLRANNNNHEKYTKVYSINNKNSKSEVSKVSNIAKLDNENVETTNKDEAINLDTINTTNINKENFTEISSLNNNSNSNNNIIELENENNKTEEKVENLEIANDSEGAKIDNSVIEQESTNNEDNNNNSNFDTNNDDIAIVENNITCPPLKDAPTLVVSEGTNKNGVGDSVYDHLKGLGWKVIDENTIRINDDRLQFKNMNGQAGVDSIITIRCDFEENDKYVLYLLKLMIGDKSVSKNDNPNMDAANFDDTYYDNFENLVRRIANGTGTIEYSNRNIRVQYDGNWDYTITLTFYNYEDESSNTAPSIIENGDIIY